MEKTISYIQTHQERFLSELFGLLRIPSISASSDHKPDMQACAEELVRLLQKAGADYAVSMPTEGNPVVYAEKIKDSSLPTVLVYAHYDVMPVEPLSEWHTPPFEPEVREGRIYGRGADDDKGQGFMHIKAFESMVATGELPCNVKFMLEGEEEIGSASLNAWCREHKEMLQADVILVSDTSMIGWDTPSITCGLRGITYMEVEVSGPSHDLHSGLYGGAVVNPVNELCRIIALLTDESGRVAIPHFYDKVRIYSDTERAALLSAPFDLVSYRENIGVPEVSGESGYAVPERTGIRPALDVNGIWGGYTGEGTKTIIPSKAFAKISMRLVPDQDYREIADLFETYLRSIASPCVHVSVSFLHGGAPYVSPTDLKAYQAASQAVERTFGKRPLPFYSGGSIPIISTFEEVLGIKSILLGFGLGSDAIHAPNENYPLENFYRGIETIAWFYKYFAE